MMPPRASSPPYTHCPSGRVVNKRQERDCCDPQVSHALKNAQRTWVHKIDVLDVERKGQHSGAGQRNKKEPDSRSKQYGHGWEFSCSAPVSATPALRIKTRLSKPGSFIIECPANDRL